MILSHKLYPLKPKSKGEGNHFVYKLYKTTFGAHKCRPPKALNESSAVRHDLSLNTIQILDTHIFCIFFFVLNCFFYKL